MELISSGNGMSPAWSPDGRQIAFLSNRAEGWDLYTMPSVGGEPSRLTSGATVDDPAWSPDGRWIAVERNRSIEVVAPDGGERRRLVQDAGQAAWSPHGDLAFVRDRDLYVLTHDGEARVIQRDVSQPHWSADGRTIVCCRRGIWELDVQTGQLRQRTRNPGDASPQIAADGDIVFVRGDALAILHQDDTMSDLSGLPSPAGAPALHPSELDTIAYQLHDGGNWDIVCASLERSEIRRLTRATWTSWNARA